MPTETRTRSLIFLEDKMSSFSLCNVFDFCSFIHSSIRAIHWFMPAISLHKCFMLFHFAAIFDATVATFSFWYTQFQFPYNDPLTLRHNNWWTGENLHSPSFTFASNKCSTHSKWNRHAIVNIRRKHTRIYIYRRQYTRPKNRKHNENGAS